MADDLTTRCLAEVSQAMEAELHTNWCQYDRAPCNCCQPQRLASRLARMLAAGMTAYHEAFFDVTENGLLAESQDDVALRAVAAAREAQ